MCVSCGQALGRVVASAGCGEMDGQEMTKAPCSLTLLCSSARAWPCRQALGRVDAIADHGRYLLLHVVADHREDLLYKGVELLLEQQGRVLGLDLLETACTVCKELKRDHLTS